MLSQLADAVFTKALTSNIDHKNLHNLFPSNTELTKTVYYVVVNKHIAWLNVQNNQSRDHYFG